MSRYGNILTVFNSTGPQLTKVKNVLTSNTTVFEQVGDTFFVETTSKKNTRAVAADLSALNIEFTFYRNNISDGSELSAGGIDPAQLEKINRILFE